MILGDSLQVMASLAQREGLRGKVQCIYIDPPYGIKFNSNWQVSTISRDVKDGKREDISREPEQVKAFRDTWKDGIHSYLTYLRDRLTVARELLTESGSIFVQIGDENVHRVRAMMDDIFGDENCVCELLVKKKGAQKGSLIDPVNDYILWYSKSPRSSGSIKYRPIFDTRELDYETIDEFSRLERPDGTTISLKRHEDETGNAVDFRLNPRQISEVFPNGRILRPWPITNGGYRENQMDPVRLEGREYSPPKGRCWSHTSRKNERGLTGMERVLLAGRLIASKNGLDFKRYLDDFPYKTLSNWWDGLGGAADQIYIVQTNERIAQRCILMCTDPGDLVLDPTCGSGTTAYVAEHWGRRWITMDTSRVALALARARVMGARYPYYYLSDTPEGIEKEQAVSGKVRANTQTNNDIRHGFVYRRASYITSGQIANNAEIDVIWEEAQKALEPLRAQLNQALGKKWEEWEIPREADPKWSANVKAIHKAWWDARIARQKKIDESIARNADVEFLYDRPYEDRSRVRVAGPFTVESLSPHRVVPADEEELLDTVHANEGKRRRTKLVTPPTDFAEMVLEHLRTGGVQQSKKQDKLTFTSLAPWPGEYVNAEGRFMEGARERRAAVFIGPEFGTVSRADLAAAAREATEARFEVLIACAFNFDAHSSELSKLGPLPILKAKMNPDLHMAEELKNTGKGNLFVVFGEPDIEIKQLSGGMMQVTVKGVDVFDPNTGDIRSGGTKDIAAWFIDTDYNEESFFVRHAYFLGAKEYDPYKSLKTTLRAEIDEEAWQSLRSETSRPFPRPSTGRIAVKVINHFGDEVMKVFTV
jgi:adenine-specific DNA-methyltransferase